MKIDYINQIDSATITPSSEDSNFKFETAFNDNRLSRFGHTLGIISENIVFYNADGFSFTDIIIPNNNLTASATVTLEVNTSDSWGSPADSFSLTRLSNGWYYYHQDSLIEYDYARLVIADSTNTETYLALSKVFLGNSLTMPEISPDCDLPVSSNSVVYQNATGQIYSDKRDQLKSASIKFPSITQAQRTQIKSFFETVDITEPFYLFIWENSLDVEVPIYATLTKPLQIKKIPPLLFTLDLEFIENK